MSKLEKRLDELTKRAHARRVGMIALVEPLQWPEAARDAFLAADAAGDTAECEALIEAHHGKLPERVGDEIVAILVMAHSAMPNDDDD